MKKRNGTEYAELISENWPLVRSEGDALILCKYHEVEATYREEKRILDIKYTEEIDCIFYEVDPKNIDNEKYHQIDKLLGFPWCDIGKSPVIDSIFIDENFKKWVVVGLLSDDPIKGYIELGIKPLFESEQDIFAVSINCFNVINTKNESELLFSDMIYIRNTATVTAQPLTQDYGFITGTDHGIPVLDSLRPKIRLEYAASFQVQATGASVGEADIVLQRSMQPEGLEEDWQDVSKMAGPLTLTTGEEKRYTIAFHQEYSSGIQAGIEVKYRLVGKITDPLKTMVIHDSVNIAGNPPPTIKISIESNYPELPQEGVSVGNDLQITEVVTVRVGANIPLIDNESKLSQAITLEEGVVNPVTENSSQVSQLVEILIPDAIWFAPPATPEDNPLNVGVYEEIEGTTVTIPPEPAGYPGVSFAFNAAIYLLAIGDQGGEALLKLQKSENEGSWFDVPGQEFGMVSENSNDEERAALAFTDTYAGGIPADTGVRYRIAGQSVTVGYEVSVHYSLVNPNNTGPVAYIVADYSPG